jgi:hypothetical protein
MVEVFSETSVSFQQATRHISEEITLASLREPQIQQNSLFLLYREVLTFVDWFTATVAPPPARRILVLPMNQYADWPITFGMK